MQGKRVKIFFASSCCVISLLYSSQISFAETVPASSEKTDDYIFPTAAKPTAVHTVNRAPAAKSTTSKAAKPASASKASSSSASSGGSGSAAAKANNPLDTSTVHWQTENDLNFRQGPPGYRKTGMNIKIQPLIPLPMPHGWTYLIRPIVQFNHNPRTAPGHHFRKRTGFADSVPQTYMLTPPIPLGKSGWTMVIGGGPTAQIPHNNGTMSTHLWGIGPDAAFSLSKKTSNGTFQFTVIGDIMWSIQTKNKRKYPQYKYSTVQPNIVYSWDNGMFLISAPLIEIDWKIHHRNRVTLPVGGGMGTTLKLFNTVMTVDAKGYYNVKRIKNTARWQFSSTTTVLLKNPFAFMKNWYTN